MEHKDNIDRRLKELLSEFGRQPKAGSFDEVMRKLERRKRRRFIFMLFPGILMVGCLSFFLPGYFSPDDQKEGKEEKHKTEIFDDKASQSNVVRPGKSIPSNPGESPENEIQRASPVPSGQKDAPGDASGVAPGSIAQITDPDNVGEQETRNIPEPAPEENIFIPMAGAPPGVAGVPDSSAFVHLDRVDMLLPLFERSDEPLTALLVPDDTPLKSRRKLQCLIGLSFEPQYSTYLFTARKNDALSDEYKKVRKQQNKFYFNKGFRLKAGVLLKEQWEILCGVGFQSYWYIEKATALGGTPTPKFLQASGADPRYGFVWNAQEKGFDRTHNIFRYLSLTGSVAKIFTNRYTQIKTGIGLHMENLRYAVSAVVDDAGRYDRTDEQTHAVYAPWLATLNIKAGIVENLGSRMQMQIVPTMFCSVNSMFKSDYIIKQRPVGFACEFLLLFRLGKK